MYLAIKSILTKSLFFLLFLGIFSGVAKAAATCPSEYKFLENSLGAENAENCEKAYKARYPNAVVSCISNGKTGEIPIWIVCGKGDVTPAGSEAGNSWVLREVINPLLAWIVELLSKLINFIGEGVNAMLAMAFFAPETLKSVWKDLVQFANYAFALILIVVSVMQILGVKADNYSIKKYLPNFIAAVILVNLSWIICLLILDVGEIAYKIILNSLGQSSDGLSNAMTMGGIQDSTKFINAKATAGLTDANIFMWLALSLMLFGFLVSFSLKLFFSMVIRVVAIWLLFIISPLAWIAFVVPEIKSKIWDKFWDVFGTMALMPAVVALFLGIANLIQKAYLDRSSELASTINAINANDPESLGAIGNNFSTTIASIFGMTNPLKFWQMLFVYLVIIACIKLAADYGMKNDITSGAMALGDKVFNMGKNALGRTGKFAWRQTGGRAVKKGKQVAKDYARLAGKKVLSGRLGEQWSQSGSKIKQTLGRTGKATSGAIKDTHAFFKGGDERRKAQESLYDDVIAGNVRASQAKSHENLAIKNALNQINGNDRSRAAELRADLNEKSGVKLDLQMEIETLDDQIRKTQANLKLETDPAKRATIQSDLQQLEAQRARKGSALSEIDTSLKAVKDTILTEGGRGDLVSWNRGKARTIEAAQNAKDLREAQEAISSLPLSTIMKEYETLMKSIIDTDETTGETSINKKALDAAKFPIQAYESALAQNGVLIRERQIALDQLQAPKTNPDGTAKSIDQTEKESVQKRAKFDELVYGVDAASVMSRLKATDSKAKEEFKQSYYNHTLQANGVVKGDQDASVSYSVDKVLDSIKKKPEDWTREDTAFAQATLGRIHETLGGLNHDRGRRAVEQLFKDENGKTLQGDQLRQRISTLANLTGMEGATQTERDKTLIYTQFQLDVGTRGRGFAPIIEIGDLLEGGNPVIKNKFDYSYISDGDNYEKASANDQQQMQKDVLLGFSKQKLANFEKVVDVKEMKKYFNILADGIKSGTFSDSDDKKALANFMNELAVAEKSPQKVEKIDAQLWDRSSTEAGAINQALKAYQSKLK